MYQLSCTLSSCSHQPPSQALEQINFKGHGKMQTDLRGAGPLCRHTQHKIRRLGTTVIMQKGIKPSDVMYH